MPRIQSKDTPTYTVHPDESDEVRELLLQYMSHGHGPFSSELFWYFKPWRCSRTRPAESGVYATVHGSFHGFSYYAADIGSWLMSYETVCSAQRTADSFRAAVQAGDRKAVGVHISWHQSKQWSSAPLTGISEMPKWTCNENGGLSVNDEALGLALIRQAVDPKMTRQAFCR